MQVKDTANWKVYKGGNDMNIFEILILIGILLVGLEDSGTGIFLLLLWVFMYFLTI